MCATMTDMFCLFFKISSIQGYLFKEVLFVHMYGVFSLTEKTGIVIAPTLGGG